MVALVIESEMVTDCADVYVPAAGEKVGVGTAPARLMVYVAEATPLLASPVAIAMALRVSVDETVMVPV